MLGLSQIRSFISSNCDDQTSIGCGDFDSSEKCTQSCLEEVSTATCNDFNTKVDKCNGVKTKEINMEYDKCFNSLRSLFIMAKCDTIKNKYVPLGLGQFSI